MPPLKIYKASAGSGKTFQLTYDYLKLLFENPENYRYILAVTFTNKAAGEMKLRILNRLDALSNSKDGEDLEDNRMLQKELNKSRDQICNIASDLLTRILNDYSRFSVGTIDRFFQGVIRAFAREIGLQAGFGLELDRDRMLNEAVDQMFAQITDDPEMQDWLQRYAELRMEDNKGWNFRNDIQDLGKQLFSEYYQEKVLSKGGPVSREDIKSFIRELDDNEKEHEAKIVSIAMDALSEIKMNGYDVEGFHRGKSGVAMFFDTVASGGKYFLTDPKIAAITDNSKWISKKDIGSAKAAFAESVLQVKLGEIFELTKMILSVQSVRPYTYTMGILSDLSARIRDITNEKNQFMLSDASRFLKGLIGDNPTPFIYEKTGSAYEHIMLDEFQDTSVFQWENFMPLIDHTLAQGKENLVVGDVKQSIYRWRNGDWKILADYVENAFPGQEIQLKALEENWRSREQVVLFNNSIFSIASRTIRTRVIKELEQPGLSPGLREKWSKLLEAAYHDVEQRVPDVFKGSGGCVRGIVHQNDDGNFKEEMLRKLPEWVMELQDKGYKAGDIAVLVRFNKQGAAVAQALMDHDRDFNEDKKYCFDFISNESLFLDRNIAIQFIVALLAWLDRPNDRLNVLQLKYYYKLIRDSLHGDLHSAFNPEKDPADLLPEEFMKEAAANRRLPLFELVELIIRDFSLDARDSDLPYIQEFQSIILEIQRDDPGSIHDFLEYWTEFGHKKALHVSDEQDAIQIMTIHKAKGLEFKAVIVPLCNWELTTDPRRDTILWCDTEGTPFSSINMVPVKYKSDLKNTFFVEDYLEEMIMGYVDNLNLLYVALTRAEEALYIGAPGLDPDKPEKLDNIGHLLVHSWLKTDFNFDLGQCEAKNSETAARGEEPWALNQYPVNIRNDSLRLRLKSNDYFLNREEEVSDHVGFGNLMHEIFALIRNRDDVSMAVEKFKQAGLIKASQAENLIQLISAKISRSEVQAWFKGECVIINERAILLPGGGSYRPDRVMLFSDRTVIVDYKFGDQKESVYQRQVSKYVELLEQMSYRNVEGYIWYVMFDEIEKVN